MSGRHLLASLGIALAMANPALAWEASRPVGPLGTPQTRAPMRASIRAEGQLLSPQTVAYPYESGARLGDAWDFVTNTRLYSQCVEYGAAATDSYQQATLDSTRSVDDETLSAALNINTSAHAGGSLGIFSGSAEGSFGLSTSYMFNSKDDVIITHASVVNGATYVTSQTPISQTPNPSVSAPTLPNIAGVRLSKAALDKLKSETIEPFRAACGDGFVAAIGTGADLYILYRFTHIDHKLSVEINTAMSAGGGFGPFSAGGSFSSTASLNDLVSHDQLGLYFVQNGGEIGLVPAKVDDIQPKINNLAKEAFNGHGRPLYVIVVPYSELNNWPYSTDFPPALDLRTSLIRYSQRLKSVFFELQQVIADFHDTQTSPDKYQYLHDAFTGLRVTDYAKMNDDVLNEINKVRQYMYYLDGVCKKHPSATECTTNVNHLVSTKPIDYDDFRFWVMLPIPTNTLTTQEVQVILDHNTDIVDRKFFLSMALYKHWVERISSERCALFVECLNSNQRRQEYTRIRKSLGI